MRSTMMIMALAFVAQANAQDDVAKHTADKQDFTDKLVNQFVVKLFDRVLESLPRHYTDLEDTTLEKPAAIQPRIVSSFVPATRLSQTSQQAVSATHPKPLGYQSRLSPMAPFSRPFSAFTTQKKGIRMAAELGQGIEEKNAVPLTKLVLTSGSGASAEIYTLGATVTSFKARGSELLAVRPDAKFDGSKPISGGLPFCWPQFGPGQMQQHGFARNCEWKVKNTQGGESPSVTFELKSNEYTQEMWKYNFRNTYTITVGDDDTLTTRFAVTNTDEETFAFTGALHSYFSVGDIAETALRGKQIKGSEYLDRMTKPPERVIEEREEVTVDKETDRCYEGMAGRITIADKANKRSIFIDNKKGYVDTCVWNPWNEGMGSKEFICVESGVVKNAVKVEPGRTWVGEMSLSFLKDGEKISPWRAKTERRKKKAIENPGPAIEDDVFRTKQSELVRQIEAEAAQDTAPATPDENEIIR